MKTFLASFAGFLMLIVLSNVCAEGTYFTGNELKRRLDNKEEGIRYATALGYILGVHDVSSGVSICSPSQAIAGQLVDIVLKYLAEHPQKLHEKASDLVLNALSLAFPCRK
jgi:hypothetical protein